MEELKNKERELIQKITATETRLDSLKRRLVSVKHAIELQESVADFSRGESWADDKGVKDGRSGSGIIKYKRLHTNRKKRKFRKTNRKGRM